MATTLLNLFQEITKKYLIKVKPRWQEFQASLSTDDKSWHFDNIFGKNSRILIADITDKQLPALLDFIHNKIGVDVTFDDLLKGTIDVKKGEKSRTLKIAKLLSGKLLDFYSRIKELKNVPYAIIVSRSPIDIARMSDHTGITSCLSPGELYWKSCVAEANYGGTVAYAVPTLPDDLQKKEIFADSQRNKPGIKPLTRLRLRRMSDGDIDILLPEKKVYGQHLDGFITTIWHWVKSIQRPVFQKILEKYKDFVEAFEHFQLRGGSYQDTFVYSLWSDLFNVTIPSTKKLSKDEREIDLDQKVATQLVKAKELQYFHVDAKVEDNVITQCIITVTFDYALPLARHTNAYKFFANYYLPYLKFEESSTTKHDNSFAITAQFNASINLTSVMDFERFLDNVKANDNRYENIKEALLGFLFYHNYIDEKVFPDIPNFTLNTEEDYHFVYESEKFILGDLTGLAKELFVIDQDGDINFYQENEQRRSLDYFLAGKFTTTENIEINLELKTTPAPLEENDSIEFLLQQSANRTFNDKPITAQIKFDSYNISKLHEYMRQINLADLKNQAKKIWQDFYQQNVTIDSSQLTIQRIKNYLKTLQIAITTPSCSVSDHPELSFFPGEITIVSNQYWYHDDDNQLLASDAYNLYKRAYFAVRTVNCDEIKKLKPGYIVAKMSKNQVALYYYANDGHKTFWRELLT